MDIVAENIWLRNQEPELLEFFCFCFVYRGKTQLLWPASTPRDVVASRRTEPLSQDGASQLVRIVVNLPI